MRRPAEDRGSGAPDPFERLVAAGCQTRSVSPEPFPEAALARASLVAIPSAERADPALPPILADAALRGVPVVWLGDPGLSGSQRLEELEARLTAAGRAEALGRLVGGVAHDFNNVLSVVSTLSELLLRFGPEDNPDREDLEEILSASRRGSELTRQLLAFGRAEVGEPERVDVSERVQSVRKLLGKLLPEDVRLETELDADLPPVLADPVDIDHILLELVALARSRLQRGGTIRLATTRDETGGVTVRANIETRQGETVDEDERAGAAKSAEAVRDVLARHGGALGTEEGPSGVPVFRVDLPAARPHVPGEPSTARLADGRRVLVVEDDPPVRRATCRALEALGYQVEPVESIAEALASIHALRPDAVLCDAVLGDGWGTELRQRANDEIGDEIDDPIPFVFVSGHEEHPVLDAVRRSGVPSLRKPYTGDSLARALGEATGDAAR